MPPRRSLSVAALVVVAAVALSAPVAYGTTLEVTTTLDSSPAAALIPGSLRALLASAHDGDTVHVPAGFYPLQSELTTSRSITIRGDGARGTVLDGQDQSRVLELAPGAGTHVTVAGLTVEHGSADIGGGIWTHDDTLTLVDAAVLANTATTVGNGLTSQGTLTMNRVLVAGNHSTTANAGGGIAFVSGGTAVIANSTIVGNSALDQGGGIFQPGGTLELLSDTLAGNSLSAPGATGGDVYSAPPVAARVVLAGTVFAPGPLAATPNCNFTSTAVADLGGNADGLLDSCRLGAVDDVLSDDLRLGSLQDNGGPTDTLLPVPDSPLVDAVDANSPNCGGSDQRGVPRPQGGRCDIGAVERALPPVTVPPVTPPATPPGPGGSTPPALTAPRLGSISLTHVRFRVSPHATAVAASTPARKQPLGTRFRFTLSTDARVKITFTHTAAGLRGARGRCVAPTQQLAHARARHCTRTFGDGVLTRTHLGHGKVSVAFTGRIGQHKALAARTYLATITATNRAGSARPARLKLTIVP